MTASTTPVAEPIEIAEYETTETDLSARQAQLLQAAAGKRLTVTPSSGGYSVRASSYVGSISIEGRVVHVVPKIPVSNLLYLLTWSTHRVSFDHVDAGHAMHHLTAAVAAWYARALEQALVLGVDRTYVEETDRLVAIRGRVDWPAHINALGLPTPISCRFDEWSIDTRPNRLVVAAALALLRNPTVAPESAFTLRRLLKLLPGVGPLHSDDLTNPAPMINRLNQHYESSVTLAQLILHGSGHAHGSGTASVSAFMVDMNAVFEDFVFSNLRHRLRDIWSVTRQEVVPLGTRGGQIPGEPDLLFRDTSGAPVLVADSKYKLTSDGRGHSSDYYQLLAYCTALGLPRGVLIYCEVGHAAAPAKTVQVRNTNTVLETARVRLSGSPKEISEEFARLTRQLLEESGFAPTPSPPSVWRGP